MMPDRIKHGLGCVLLMTAVGHSEAPPPSCSGTPPFKFAIQVSIDGGNTWLSNAATLKILRNQQRSIMARVLMTVTTGQTQGWSFSLEYDNSYQATYGGSMTQSNVTTLGTQTKTVQNGGPPDIDQTAIRAGFKGFTQGVVIDTDQAITLNPTTNFITSKACYSITAGSTVATYPIFLKVSHNIGNPNIRAVITQGGSSIVPCAANLTLTVNVNNSQSSPGGCVGFTAGPQAGGPGDSEGVAPMSPLQSEAAGTDFKRGDANSDGAINITDPIFVLADLFQQQLDPPCKDAADANDDNAYDISDAVYLLSFLFSGGSPPPAPFPSCGPDLTDTLALTLKCAAYAQCSQADSDCDGLTDGFEALIGTQPGDSTKLCANLINLDAADTDNDGFLDGQEVLPTGVPGCFDNGAMGAFNISETAVHGLGSADGADPKTPDLFVEIDWMSAPDHNHRPADAHLSHIVDEFTQRGIKLHFDTGVPPFALPHGNGEPVTHIQQTQGLVQHLQIKDEFFDAQNKCNVFHYATAVHSHNVMGLGEIFGDDFTFVVSAGPPPPFPLSPLAQVAIIMHELGHNLGLNHGGNRSPSQPNYRSIMSYRAGPTRISCTGDATSVDIAEVDYSQQKLDDINETDLDEPSGICRVGGVCNDHGTPLQQCVGVDFNLNGVPGETDYAFDTDSDGSLTILSGYNDWSNIKYFIFSQQGGGGSVPDDPCFPWLDG